MNKLKFFSVIVGLVLLNFVIVAYKTENKEYFGSYVASVRYYEDWNEDIHTIYSRSCGKNCIRTQDYSYIQHYSQYWVIVNNYNEEYQISEKRYMWFKDRFNNSEVFHNLNRYYYSNDGDMYQISWPNTIETFYSLNNNQNYEN